MIFGQFFPFKSVFCKKVNVFNYSGFYLIVANHIILLEKFIFHILFKGACYSKHHMVRLFDLLRILNLSSYAFYLQFSNSFSTIRSNYTLHTRINSNLFCLSSWIKSKKIDVKTVIRKIYVASRRIASHRSSYCHKLCIIQHIHDLLI